MGYQYDYRSIDMCIEQYPEITDVLCFSLLDYSRIHRRVGAVCAHKAGAASKLAACSRLARAATLCVRVRTSPAGWTASGAIQR